MKEDFLHYLWKFKKFNTLNLMTTQGEVISIIHVGRYLEQAGPDFFNAQIIIGNQKWAGSVEIHLKSSDWYAHHHEQDSAYENVILHVVWEHDIDVFRKDNSVIPVLELSNYVASKTVVNYQSLRSTKSWVFCENQLADFDEFILRNWQERLFFERLERKSKSISNLLIQTNSDWESVLFNLLAKNFGLNTNGEQFLKIVGALPFSVIRKESFEPENIEALLLGNAGLLDSDKEDSYFKDLKFRYYYLLQKYQLEKPVLAPVQFFKHRPDNFPTIRLSQLAMLYHVHRNLFSKIIELNSAEAIYSLFEVSATSYWLSHYQFDKVSPKKKKMLSKSFIDLLIINTIVPIQFAYAQSQGKENSDNLIQLLHAIAPEKNAVIDKFKSFGIVANNTFETQSLLQLKNEYCNYGKCMNCAIGIELIKN
ncbi:MAG: hypothetical protein RLZZ323_1188 [Bacteroidota bacterium]|jgi:hypothetical protein